MRWPGQHEANSLAGSAALVIAHPGHELRVHGWLESAKPQVFILTNGSGSISRSRIESSRRVVEESGAQTASIFGRWSDAQLYAFVLARDHAPLIDLAEELSETLAITGVSFVAGDATEGYNPGHDVCRLLIDTAIMIARSRRNRRIASYDFTLYHHPCHQAEAGGVGAISMELDADSFHRKLTAANAYPELAGEVAAAFQKLGVEAFRHECLRPVVNSSALKQECEQAPPYERYGERQVAAGKYPQVLRFREHMRPLASALWEHARRISA